MPVNITLHRSFVCLRLICLYSGSDSCIIVLSYLGVLTIFVLPTTNANVMIMKWSAVDLVQVHGRSEIEQTRDTI